MHLYKPVYIYPSALHNAMHEHTSAAGSIACVYLQSSDRLIIRNILLHYFITLAFTVQQLHIEARYIAKFNAFALRFISCKFRKNTFLYAIISTTVYDPNLFFKSQKYLSHLLVRQLWKGLKYHFLSNVEKINPCKFSTRVKFLFGLKRCYCTKSDKDVRSQITFNRTLC